MSSPWFTPGATTESWFSPQPGSAAAASTSPQPQSGYSPFLGSMFGQNGPPQSPGIGAPPPSLSAPEPPSDFASLYPYLQLGLKGAGAAGLPGTGALGGLLTLGSGAANGNPLQIGQGALGLVGGANALFNSGSTLGGTLSAPIGSTLSAAAPGTAAALSAVGSYLPLAGALLTGFSAPTARTPAAQDARAQQAMIASATSAAMALLSASPVGAVAAPVLGAAMGINQALNPRTNYGLNKMAGALGPNATAGIGATANAATQMGDFSAAPTPTLEDFIRNATQALAGRYDTAGSGAGTSTSSTAVSRYVDGLRASDPQAFARSNQDLDLTRNSLLSAVRTLQGRGVSDAELGGLAPAGWGAQQFAGTTMPQLFTPEQKAFAGGATDPMASSLLGDPGRAAIPYTFNNVPDTINTATGGPLWSALSYLFGPSQSNPGNDPRAGAGYWDALSKLGVRAPQLNMAALSPRAGDMTNYRNMINDQAYQAFTSGGN